MPHYFQSGERVMCRCKRHEAKGLQTKHALKAVRYERRQVETFFDKQEHHKGFYNQSNIQGRQSNAKKNPRNDREKEKPLKTVPRKHGARKRNFTYMKEVSNSNKDKRE
jgi:hypothetical protein